MSKIDPSAPPAAEYQAMIAERRQTLRQELAAILSGPDPIVCEVGAGHGHFLTAYAQQHPTECCIGVDIIGERVERANRKRDRAKLDRLHFLHAEANLFLSELPNGVIGRTFILFPDPWPKTRHHKHRILRSDFLSLLHSRSKTGAELFFRTDFEPYFDAALAEISQHPLWEPTITVWPFEHRSVFQERAVSYFSFSARVRP